MRTQVRQIAVAEQPTGNLMGWRNEMKPSRSDLPKKADPIPALSAAGYRQRVQFSETRIQTQRFKSGMRTQVRQIAVAEQPTGNLMGWRNKMKPSRSDLPKKADPIPLSPRLAIAREFSFQRSESRHKDSRAG